MTANEALVVSSDPVLPGLLRHNISDEGYQIKIAKGSRGKPRKVLEKGQPYFAIVGITMPTIEGCRHYSPILTGWHESDSRNQCFLFSGVGRWKEPEDMPGNSKNSLLGMEVQENGDTGGGSRKTQRSLQAGG